MKRWFISKSMLGSRSDRIYLDYASITPVDLRVEKVVNEKIEAVAAVTGAGAHGVCAALNPSSIHADGVAARKLLDASRASAAAFLNAHADEVVFTGSGTESNNLAILGAVEAYLTAHPEKGYADIHILASEIEHSSVLETVFYLRKKGATVELIPVDETGIVCLDALKKMLRPNTLLVSVMMANNEIGTIEPIRDVVKVVRDFRKASTQGGQAAQTYLYPIVHTDACQAPLFEEIDLTKLGVDLLSLDAHKVYGPRGVGLLYIRRGVELMPIIHGGGQEKGLRSGTENIPGIVGLAAALDIAKAEQTVERARLIDLRDYFIKKLKEIEPGTVVHGSSASTIASPHVINVSIPGIDHEFFVLQLDARGISCSTKSSCLRDADESYVLKAIGHPSRLSLRFSFGRWTTRRELDRTLDAIRALLKK